MDPVAEWFGENSDSHESFAMDPVAAWVGEYSDSQHSCTMDPVAAWVGENSESQQSFAMDPVAAGVGENSDSQQRSIVPQVMNIVAGFSVGCSLDPKQVASKARNAEYDPRRFNAVIMRIKQPRSTALIFPSGRIVVTGAKTEVDSKVACRKFARFLQKLGYPVEFSGWKVINIVGLVQVPFKINLIMLNAGHYRCSQWEPELFPGVLYRMLKPKMSLLIFQSGKVVFVGVKEKEDLLKGFELIHPILIEYRKSEEKK